jgi:hypothetical protein
MNETAGPELAINRALEISQKFKYRRRTSYNRKRARAGYLKIAKQRKP